MNSKRKRTLRKRKADLYVSNNKLVFGLSCKRGGGVFGDLSASVKNASHGEFNQNGFKNVERKRRVTKRRVLTPWLI